MAHIEIPAGNEPERTRMWQMVPEMQRGVGVFGKAIFGHSTISLRERELARMRIAELNACPI